MKQKNITGNTSKYLHDTFEREKPLLGFCLLITYVWGLISHAYGLLHGNFSHDSLYVIYASIGEERWKIQLGRFLVPIYRILTRGSVDIPWLIGLISLLYIGLSVYLVIKMFDVKSRWAIVLISGIMVTNVTVTAMIAAFVYEFDFDMLALLFSVIAAFLWHKYSNRLSFIVGILFVTASIGLYQSYLSVTITLMILLSIRALLNGEENKHVIIKGLKGVLLLVCGGLLYFAGQTIVHYVTGIALTSRADVLEVGNTNYILMLFETYHCFATYLTQTSPYPIALSFIIVGTMFLLTLFIVISTIKNNNNIKLMNTIFILLLGILVPFGMNVTYFLARGYFHHLMCYSIWFTYIVFVALVARISSEKGAQHYFKHKNALKIICIIIVGIFIGKNIVFANTGYIKKDLEQKSTLSFMTRVVERMENQEDYVVGETPVAFIGISNLYGDMPGFEHISTITGLKQNNAISYDLLYSPYFKYILNYPINICSKETADAMKDNETVKNMPIFPAHDCIKMIDGVMVIKMAETAQ